MDMHSCQGCNSQGDGGHTYLSHCSPVVLALQTQWPVRQSPVLPAGLHLHCRFLQQRGRESLPGVPAQCPQLLHKTVENARSYQSHARRGKIINRAISLSNPAAAAARCQAETAPKATPPGHLRTADPPIRATQSSAELKKLWLSLIDSG